MIVEIVVHNNYNVGTQNRREMNTTINNIDKILKNIEDNKNKSTSFVCKTPRFYCV